MEVHMNDVMLASLSNETQRKLWAQILFVECNTFKPTMEKK